MGDLREPTMEVAIGFRGVGKTYTFNEFSDDYIRNLKRPILVFDVNNEFNEGNRLFGYKAIDFDITEKKEYKRSEQIRNIKVPGKYRIIPYKKNGQPMNISELLLTATTIVSYFRNGLVLLEDLNKYTNSHFKQEFIGTFVGLRHVGVDLVLHFQSLHAIPPKVWDGMQHLRWHKCAEKIIKYKKRVTNFELFAIAEAIVDYKYRTDQRFYLWVDALGNKIQTSPDDFKKGCEIYLAQNPSALRGLLGHIDLNSGSKKYNSQTEAVSDFIKTKEEEYLSQ
jgi:hypothetical protein